jgi:tetratricopeptide (TPR) repeat protein
VEGVLGQLAEALKDRYAIQRELGRGGMATVYLATDLRHDRQVAIKVLRPELAASLGAERFLREIKTTAQLSHPNILPLFDSGVIEGWWDRGIATAGQAPSLHPSTPPSLGLLYYVMPFVEGETLAERIERDGALPEADALRIASEVLGALEYAHRQGVIHRDIKPANILLSAATGHALVADFGIARAISAAGADNITRDGVVGTPVYMAPEQATGDRVTPATDLYAVGLVLYECVTGGRLPPAVFQSRTDWALVPSRFRGALERALRPRPEDRWPDAGAMRAALESGWSVRRGRWLGLAAAGAVVALAVALFSLGRMGAPSPTTDEARLVVLPFTARGADDLEYLGEGMVDLLSAKLDGTGTWRTVDPRAVLSLVAREADAGPIDPDEGRRIARRLDASFFVLGSLIGVGGQVRLDASLYGDDAGRGVLAQASVEGGRDDVLALLDSMAVSLLSRYGDAEDARLTQIAAMTTQSLPALKAYLRGVRALRAGEFPVAEADFQEAVALDSAFALAWYQLSITADWLVRSDLARAAADQAVRHAERLPERDRRLLEALQAARRGDFDETERRLRAILGTHPDDVEAWSQLGEALFHFGPARGRPLRASADAWRRLIELEPGRATGYIHLARLAASTRDLAGLDSLSRRALDLAPQGDRGLEMRLLRLMLRDGPREREQVFAELRDAPDDVLAEVLWAVGTFARDTTIMRPLIAALATPARSPEMRASVFANLAALEAAEGHAEASRMALDSLTALDPVQGLAHEVYLALLPTLEGDPTRLAGYAERLAAADWRSVPPSVSRSTWISANDGLYEYYRRYLLGLAYALSGRDSAARAEAQALERATPPPSSGSLLTDFAATIRATVAWQAGRIDEGLSAIGQVRLHLWYQLASPSPFLSQAYGRYLRALLLERAGRLDEARRWYGSFQDTSPQDLPYLASARARSGP